MGTLQMIQITPEELKTMIVEGVKEVLESISTSIQPATEKELYTKNEAANKLKVSLSTLNNWIRDGKLPVCGIGSRILIKSEDLRASLRDKSPIQW